MNSAAADGHQIPTELEKSLRETCRTRAELRCILLWPDDHVGSIEKQRRNLWIYENGEMRRRSVTYVPALHKIFDEILVHAAGNKRRDSSMDSLKVVIDAEQNWISVFNNGVGVPVEFHRKKKVYVPEFIFGHLFDRCVYEDDDYDDEDDAMMIDVGRNGHGVKLANIFSTEFVVEIGDGKRQKKYRQVFSRNMRKIGEPIITECKEGENWTKVTFKPDLAKFNMTHLEDDVVALMKKRVVDLAGCLGKTVKVELNGQRVPVESFEDYVDLYLKSASTSTTEPPKRYHVKPNEKWEIVVALSEGQFQQVSFVNGIATIRGGPHVDYITNQIANYVSKAVNKSQNANVKALNVKSNLSVFINARINNPDFYSPTKELLISRGNCFGSPCELTPKFLKDVATKSGILDCVLSAVNFNRSKALKKTDGAKTEKINGIEKLEDAKAPAIAELGVVERDFDGAFPPRGKLLNVRPSIVRVELITPIVKATHSNGTVLSFHTMPEYESWKESLMDNASGWSIKYYKEEIEELRKHKRDLISDDHDDDEAIELAFGKKKIEERKNWRCRFGFIMFCCPRI